MSIFSKKKLWGACSLGLVQQPFETWTGTLAGQRCRAPNATTASGAV